MCVGKYMYAAQRRNKMTESLFDYTEHNMRQEGKTEQHVA